MPSARRVRPSAEGRALARLSEVLAPKVAAAKAALLAAGHTPAEAEQETNLQVLQVLGEEEAGAFLDMLAADPPRPQLSQLPGGGVGLHPPEHMSP